MKNIKGIRIWGIILLSLILLENANAVVPTSGSISTDYYQADIGHGYYGVRCHMEAQATFTILDNTKCPLAGEDNPMNSLDTLRVVLNVDTSCDDVNTLFFYNNTNIFITPLMIKNDVNWASYNIMSSYHIVGYGSTGTEGYVRCSTYNDCKITMNLTTEPGQSNVVCFNETMYDSASTYDKRLMLYMPYPPILESGHSISNTPNGLGIWTLPMARESRYLPFSPPYSDFRNITYFDSTMNADYATTTTTTSTTSTTSLSTTTTLYTTTTTLAGNAITVHLGNPVPSAVQLGRTFNVSVSVTNASYAFPGLVWVEKLESGNTDCNLAQNTLLTDMIEFGGTGSMLFYVDSTLMASSGNIKGCFFDTMVSLMHSSIETKSMVILPVGTTTTTTLPSGYLPVNIQFVDEVNTNLPVYVGFVLEAKKADGTYEVISEENKTGWVGTVSTRATSIAVRALPVSSNYQYTECTIYTAPNSDQRCRITYVGAPTTSTITTTTSVGSTTTSAPTTTTLKEYYYDISGFARDNLNHSINISDVDVTAICDSGTYTDFYEGTDGSGYYLFENIPANDVCDLTFHDTNNFYKDYQYPNLIMTRNRVVNAYMTLKSLTPDEVSIWVKVYEPDTPMGDSPVSGALVEITTTCGYGKISKTTNTQTGSTGLKFVLPDKECDWNIKCTADTYQDAFETYDNGDIIYECEMLPIPSGSASIKVNVKKDKQPYLTGDVNVQWLKDGAVMGSADLNAQGYAQFFGDMNTRYDLVAKDKYGTVIPMTIKTGGEGVNNEYTLDFTLAGKGASSMSSMTDFIYNTLLPLLELILLIFAFGVLFKVLQDMTGGSS